MPERRRTMEGTMASVIDDVRERLRVSLDEISEVVGDKTRQPKPTKPTRTALPKPSRELQALIKEGAPPPLLGAKASRRADGRRVPLVLALVRDAAGRTRPGIPVHLTTGDGAIIDRGTTGAGGVVLLRFPRRKALDDPAKGRVVVVGHHTQDVTVPASRQIELVDLEVDPLPDVPGIARLDKDALMRSIDEEVRAALDAAAAGGSSGNGGGTGSSLDASTLGAAASTAALTALGKQMQAFFGGTGAGDVFTRLPTDFSTEVCEAIAKIAGEDPDPLLSESFLASRPDPLLGGLTGGPGTALTRRTTKVVRTTIVRLAPPDDSAVSPTGAEPARYLVRVRQRWVFAGYSLGELAEVEPLDPGAVVRDVTQLVQRTVQSAERATEDQVRRTLSTVVSQLQRVSSVDNVVRVAASADTNQRTQALTSVGTDPVATIAGGVIGAILGGPVGAIAGGALGALAGGVDVGAGVEADLSVRSTVTTTTNLDTALQVNQLTQNAASMVNQVVRTASAVATELERTTGQAVDRVSPLLSRVTNLLRWTIYENYIVCNEIEDVQRIFDVPLVESLGDPTAADIFTADDVLEYRRLWEPRLLDRSLRGNFDAIKRAIHARDTVRTVNRITIRIDYRAALITGLLRINLGALEVAVTLRPGDVTQTVTMNIPPTPANQLDQMLLALTAQNVPAPINILGTTITVPGSVDVTAMRLWFDRSPAADQDQFFNQTQLNLRVAADAQLAVGTNLTLIVPEDTGNPELDPLVRHVNKNRSHYLGLIAQAALTNPALRDDSRHLAVFGSGTSTGGDAAIWRLPIVGFEGGRVLVVAPADETDAFVQRLRDEDGAGTIVQLAAPGSYAEALQGLTELLDAKGLLHPALLAPPSPLLMPAALIDAANKQLIPLGGGIVSLPGTANAQQPAGVAEGVITNPLSGVNLNLPVP